MKNFEESDFNQRQLQMMAGEIALFKGEEISLGDLVKRLKALHRALESPSDDWSENFLSEWGSLETMRAADLDRKERGVAASYDETADIRVRALASEALERLDHLVRERLKSE
ncbi:hypothetical protein ACFFJT_14445 [Dyella flava]|uniref:Uncharacterized protein n=1 Tax=Dyella flava TaxID=1920170 RepID=A0ABS2K5G8_9GAMM|nr:hypothetical protein [Dyella flava]MBM7125997.1 hypothetical protein [Dyella flava]